MNKFIFLFFILLGCSTKPEGQDTGLSGMTAPIFICSHPNTQYEAQIETYYSGGPNVKRVYVIIEQGEISFVASLNKPNNKYKEWHRIINVLNFDCTKDYDYAFVAKESDD